MLIALTSGWDVGVAVIYKIEDYKYNEYFKNMERYGEK